jgi:hypothetical protein
MLDILAPTDYRDDVKDLPRGHDHQFIIVENDDNGDAYCIGWADTRPEADSIAARFA